MPASNADYQDAFRDLTGSAGGQEAWYGESTAGWGHWHDMFEETGIINGDREHDIDAFENFLIAFYPQEGMSADDWWYVRQEFYDMYGIDDHDIDWEAYREAIGYGRA